MPLVLASALIALVQTQSVNFELSMPRSMEPATVSYVVADCLQNGKRKFKVEKSPRERKVPITIELPPGKWSCNGYIWLIDQDRLDAKLVAK